MSIIRTIGDLKAALAEMPDDMPIFTRVGRSDELTGVILREIDVIQHTCPDWTATFEVSAGNFTPKHYRGETVTLAGLGFERADRFEEKQDV